MAPRQEGDGMQLDGWNLSSNIHTFMGKMVGKPLRWWAPSCWTPARSLWKNKYPLCEVYMGLIIKGTITRVPPFFLWHMDPTDRILYACVHSTAVITMTNHWSFEVWIIVCTLKIIWATKKPGLTFHWILVTCPPSNTPLKFNIAQEKWWLEDYIGQVTFQRLH